MPAVAAGQVDPSDLTGAQLSALRLVAQARLIRVKGGYQGRGTRRVTLAVVRQLARLGLVRAWEAGGHPSLEATGKGRMTVAVADQRRRGR